MTKDRPRCGGCLRTLVLAGGAAAVRWVLHWCRTTRGETRVSEQAAETVWGEIDGRTITFPMEVTDMDAATLVFSVPAAAAS